MNRLILSLAFALGLTAPQLNAATITAYTGELPPYTISADAPNPGISHELLTEMAKRAGVDLKIEYLPWKRAQVTVQKTPNALLFTATRTQKREPLYGWVVEMAAPSEVFVTTSASVDSFEAGAALDRVAVMGGTPRERRLDENGLANAQHTKDTATAARLLEHDRVDAWYTLDQRAAYVFKSEGFDPASLVFGAPQRTTSNWLASNLEFDPEIAAKLAAALEEMRADGTYDAVLAKYLN